MNLAECAPNKGSVQPVRTVLVVDDNTLVREMVCTVLKDEGIRVIDADGPTRALELAALFDVPPDLLICDISMPVMNGAELYRLIEQRFPEQPVLFITANPDEHLRCADTVVTEGCLLRKPFRCAELVERVERMLG